MKGLKTVSGAPHGYTEVAAGKDYNGKPVVEVKAKGNAESGQTWATVFTEDAALELIGKLAAALAELKAAKG